MTVSSQVVKVLVVDDSKVSRDLLTFIIHSDPQLKVVGYAEDGEDVLDAVKRFKPDVITMDIIMPKVDGFEATREVMRHHPIPIIIVSSIYTKGDILKSFQAIEAGALAILEKSKGLTDPNYQEHKSLLIETIKTMSGVRLITKKHSKMPQKENKLELPRLEKGKTKEEFTPLTQRPDAVVIGASLGGPQALATILSQLPASFPIPIFIVQHIAFGFVNGLVDWLSGITPLKVSLAKDREKAQKGFVYIAPDHYHLEITPGHIMRLTEGSAKEFLKPSIGRLFHSASDTYGPNCIGILLTGMGRDGAEDLLYMKKNGALTLAQNEDSCVIFGMPKEAVAINAATKVISLEKIAQFLIRCVQQR